MRVRGGFLWYLPTIAGALFVGLAVSFLANGDERFARERERMVERQLAARGIECARVLDAMRAVPRHEFVPDELRAAAYRDRPLPIGHDQTISQPYIVAFMTEQLAVSPGDRVLEIGTGSGYQAAVLAELAGHVHTIEIVEPLADSAAAVLEHLGYENITVMAGDGYRGWPEHAPFDSIMVTAAPERIPEPLVDQLREGGRMVIPVGPVGGVQELKVLRKEEGGMIRESVMPVRFVPMTGGP